MKNREKSTLLVLIGMLGVAMLGIHPISGVEGEEASDGPPFLDDVGTYFEITDSSYLNITLVSSEVVRVILESVPRMVCFFIESNSSATMTDLMLTGFEPNTTYYRYQEGYLLESFTTGSVGDFWFTQDISEPHHVYIQEDESTLYITSDYTFTGNITENIVVAADNIVINGNGFALQGPGHGYGFYLYGRSHVTIKNVIIKGWTLAISLMYGCVDNTISKNSMMENWYAITLRLYCSYNAIRTCKIAGSYYGIYLYGYSSDNVISGNTILDNNYGIVLWMYCTGCVIYHNNIVDNTVQAEDAYPAYTDWHHPYLLEGNYWSDYLGVDDGSGTGKHAIAGDGIGDTNIPWYHDYYPLMSTWPPATVDIDPDALNLKTDDAKWITGYIELPEGYDVADIDLATVWLNDTVPAVTDPRYGFVWNASEYIQDHDEDGNLERMVKFNRTEAISLIRSAIEATGWRFRNITLTVTAETALAFFEGRDSVKVIVGDVNGDNAVDIFDLAKVGLTYFTFAGEPEYDFSADVNEDGIIDVRDLQIVALNYGKS